MRRQLDIAGETVSSNSKKLNNAELEEIVLCAGHVIAALWIHGKTVAAFGIGRVQLKAGYKTGLRIDGECLKLRALLDYGIRRLRVRAHENQEFFVIGKLSEADGTGVDFGRGVK